MARIVFLAPDTDAYVDSVVRHLPEFEALSGDTVELRIIGSDQYFSNDIGSFLSGEEPADVYMSGPVLLWEHVGAGFVEPLDEYVARAGEGYDFDDFVPNLIAANRWTGIFGEPLGEGPLLEIPVNCESYNLAYDPQVLAELGMDVPTTWADYFAVARRIAAAGVAAAAWAGEGAATEGAGPTASGPAPRGFAQRGTQVWHTMYTGFATQFWSSGATDFDADGRSAIASPEAVGATEAFVSALRDAGPRGWLDQRWYELALDFCDGGYGLMVDSDHYVAFIEDRERSRMAGRTRYAMPPAGPTGDVSPNLWTWSLVMNARSGDKDAAWRFIEWASSRGFLLRSAGEGNMNPTRTSIWDDAGFLDSASGWNGFVEVSRALAERHARVLVTPATNSRAIADRWVRALREAYAGEDAATALRRAAEDIDVLVEAGCTGAADASTGSSPA